MEFLRSFLRLHLAGKPVVASPNVGCFLRLRLCKISKLSFYGTKIILYPIISGRLIQRTAVTYCLS